MHQNREGAAESHSEGLTAAERDGTKGRGQKRERDGAIACGTE